MTHIHPLTGCVPAGGDEEMAARAGTAGDMGPPEALTKSPGPGPAAAPYLSTEAGSAEAAAAVPAALTVTVDESPGLPPEERDYRTWCDPRYAIGGFDCAGGWW